MRYNWDVLILRAWSLQIQPYNVLFTAIFDAYEWRIPLNMFKKYFESIIIGHLFKLLSYYTNWYWYNKIAKHTIYYHINWLELFYSNDMLISVNTQWKVTIVYQISITEFWLFLGIRKNRVSHSVEKQLNHWIVSFGKKFSVFYIGTVTELDYA